MAMRFLFVVFFVIFFSACEEDEQVKFFVPGQDSTFQVGELYQSVDSSVVFTIEKLEDNRCPKNVTCVWSGTVLLTIRMLKPVADTVQISTEDKPVAELGGVRFEVQSVWPYPVSEKPISREVYRIGMRVSRF